MPTYEYHCIQCSHSMERLQKITDAPLKLCPQCGHETLRRGPGGGIGLSFGPGFYNTGYGKPPMETTTDSKKAPGCCPCGKNQGSCQQ